MLEYEDMHEYQLRGTDFIYERDASLILMTMGAGKSATAATAVVDLLAGGIIERCLVLGTKRIAEAVWPVEFEKWRHLADTELAVACGTPAKRSKALVSSAPIVVSNYENVVWLTGQPEFDTFDMIIYDELGKMKTASAKRFKALRRKTFKITTGLTGTLIPNNILDVWGQMHCIDGGQRLGRTKTKFKQLFYIRTGPMPWQEEPVGTASAEISALLADISFDIKPEEYTDQLPDIVPVVHRYATKRYKEYKVFADEAVIELQGQTLTAVNAGVLYARLAQWVGGALYTDNPGAAHSKDVVVVDDSRIELLKEILTDEPALIVYQFRHEADRIKEAVGGEIMNMSSDTRDIIDRWNKGLIKRLIIHPQSAGHGLNLQDGGHTVIWYSLFTTPDSHDQTLARLRRQGQASEVVFSHYLVAENTVNEDAMASLENKTAVATVFMNNLRDRIGA